MSELPSGTVTMLFADIEGSTPLVHRLEDGYGAVLNDYRRLLRQAVAESEGHEVDCRADELFAVFQDAHDGVSAAAAAQRMLGEHPWPSDVSVKARMGLHTGTPALEGGAYLGVDVHRAIRICSAGHGGQVLLSRPTVALVEDGFQVRDLGSYSLAGLPAPERIFQLAEAGLRAEFPPLRVKRTDRSHRFRRPSRQSRQPTFAEGASQVRRLLPDVEDALRQPLGELGGALLVADRALTGANGFLERVDRKRLARPLAAQRKMALSSDRARQELERLQTRSSLVEALDDRRRALDSQLPDLPGRLDALRTEREITRLRDQVTTATDDLDKTLGAAARALDPLSFKLSRTRHRRVYRTGTRYLVPYVDEQGSERVRVFDTLAQAHDFRLSVQAAEKAQKEYSGPDTGRGGAGRNA